MAHTPEHPRTYVCTDCQVVHAGTVTGREAGDHHYEAPAECGACGSNEFVEADNWPHHRE
ncbi:hypothetical protein ACFR9U_16690 [Halorientalis brevis]|uniref:Small CPxCG-related zinc finger protein n=1 Tax=Halorientalis brevis TaxID=1126241 RepID=A0ABD6CFN8_9EURY|nr:hypothetical protein [Halorientalis brevis]